MKKNWSPSATSRQDIALLVLFRSYWYMRSCGLLDVEKSHFSSREVKEYGIMYSYCMTISVTLREVLSHMQSGLA